MITWNARFKNIIGNYVTLDSIIIEIEYYSAERPQSLIDLFDLSIVNSEVIDNNLEEIRDRVINKVNRLNDFEKKIDKLQYLIGRDINVGKAVRLLLQAGIPVLK